MLGGLIAFLGADVFAVETSPREAFPDAAATFDQQCAVCHTIGGGEKRGPDLLGVTLRRRDAWLQGYIPNAPEYQENDPLGRELADEYPEVQMPSLPLSEEETRGLIEFLDAFEIAPPEGAFVPEEREAAARATTGTEAERASLVSPGGLIATALLLGLGLGLWRMKRPTPAKLTLVLVLGAAYWSLGGRSVHTLPGNDRGYAPEQPVAFSHQVHAGDLGMSCLSCHAGAERSPVAEIPAVENCMDCHQTVESSDERLKAGLPIMERAWASRGTADPEPIRWVRVHNLPDHTRFDHGVHVRNRMDCAVCHGPVETMERVRQTESLSMGWCLDCHRQTGRNETNTRWRTVGATEDCAACHF